MSPIPQVAPLLLGSGNAVLFQSIAIGANFQINFWETRGDGLWNCDGAYVGTSTNS